jgi:tRNA-specific 2-thiouridylase
MKSTGADRLGREAALRRFGRRSMPARVVLAMSGGVDSSVAAYLLRQQGYEVVGLFMRTGVQAASSGPERKKGCCSVQDAQDARRVADRLDIPFYVLDFAADFGRIMDYFADEYLAGRTPNPCVVCNTWLKFGKLWSYGQQLEADYIATGHYARLRPGPAGPELCRAADPAKDQSYVLFGLPRALLPHLLFPVGEYRKDQVRQLARQARLPVADKPDSVEICFVPEGDPVAVVRARRPGVDTAGVITDRQGNVLGQHTGIEQFTVGQRKGLGVATGQRRYVLEILPESRTVVIGSPEELLAAGLEATEVNWLIEPPTEPLRCQARIRYRHAPAAARVVPESSGRVRVYFETPQSAVTPGQAVVFYDGERVLGGGWIERPLRL